MATVKKIDRPQCLRLALTQTAANDPVIEKVPTSYTTKDKVGIEIMQVDYFIHATDDTLVEFKSDSELLKYGLTQLYKSGSPPSLPTEAGLIDYRMLGYHLETGVGFSFVHQPITFKPLEPILVHPASLYAWMRSDNLDAAVYIYVALWYRYVDLTPDEFQDILQTIILQDTL